ncbi:MAG TPA: MarR family transcriptional regulator [Tepidisphaeraceae bacterium]|nr:MarR family transcriptional regulator [Tepidisphaeraceae bacterium]
MNPLAQTPSTDERPGLSIGPDEDSALNAWRQMVCTYHRLQRRIEHMLAPRGLVLSQFEILAKAGIRPGLIQQDLADALLLTKGNIGAMVDRLECSGLIQRKPDSQDKRVNRLYLTDEGRRLTGALFEEHLKMVHEMMAPLSDLQQRQLRSLLQLIEPETC